MSVTKVLVTANFLCLSLLCAADDGDLAYFEDASEKKSHSKTINRLSSSRDWLGQRINATSEKLDLYFMQRFFADEVINGELNEASKAKLFFETGLRERRGLEGDIGLDVRLKLPNTEDRFNLIISSDDENDDRINDTANNNSDNERGAFTTGLQYIAKDFKKWRPKLQLGSRWGNAPELFFEGRLSRRFGHTGHNIKTTFSAAHFTRRKTIYTSHINYFYLVNSDWGFRLANRVRYFNRGGYYRFDHTPELQHRINNDHAFVYQLSASGDNRLNPYIDSYTASIRWRHRLYHSWLFLEVEPSHTYFVAPEINQDPDSEAALFIRLEMLINND